MDWGHQESLRGKVRVIERPENELEIEKQAVDCMSVDFPCPVSIQPAFHNRILISFGERPFSLALGMSKGPRPEQSWESQPLDYRDSLISELCPSQVGLISPIPRIIGKETISFCRITNL